MMPAPRVLHVDHKAAFWHRMSREYRYKYETLERHQQFACFDVCTRPASVPASQFDIMMTGWFGNPLHPYYPLEGRLPQALFGVIPKSCLLLEDMHEHSFQGGTAMLCDYLNRHYNYVIATYDCDQLTSIKARCPRVRRFYVLPHYINTEIYRDYGLEKIWDVLLYGSVMVWMYPFRNRMRRVIQALPLAVKVIERPDGRTYDPARCGESLARMINQSRIAIASPSVADYLVSKYFAISACRCVVAGPMATAGKRIWGSNYIDLNESMSDDEIFRRLADALGNPQALEQMARTMYERVHQYYSLSNYIEALREIIEDIHCDNKVVGGSRRVQAVAADRRRAAVSSARRTTGTQKRSH